MTERRIYLDHAATSWPKPPGVVEACVQEQLQHGAAASRGAYKSAERTDRMIQQVRQGLARFLSISDENRIAWTSNGTMAIHAAIHSVLWETDLRKKHVVTTATEHNSVLRTLADLEQRRGLAWTMVPCDEQGRVDSESLRQAIRAETCLVVVNHASNVTGFAQDLNALGHIVAGSDAWLMVDAAQSLGYLPLNAEQLQIDLLVGPAHKGLCGMLGTAFIAASDRVRSHLRSPWIGGTGRSSVDWAGPFAWRESIESGNINAPSVAALGAGLRFLESHSSHDFQKTAWDWIQRIVDEIRSHKSLRLVGFPDNLTELESRSRVPVVSFCSDSLDSHEMAMMLDSAMGIECRSGLHCAGAIHSYLGTDPKHGTLRMSLGHTTRGSDVETAVEGIRLLGQVAQ